MEASPVQGKGFPVDRIPAESHPTVYMFATGTGISPIKALIESGDVQVLAVARCATCDARLNTAGVA